MLRSRSCNRFFFHHSDERRVEARIEDWRGFERLACHVDEPVGVGRGRLAERVHLDRVRVLEARLLVRVALRLEDDPQQEVAVVGRVRDGDVPLRQLFLVPRREHEVLRPLARVQARGPNVDLRFIPRVDQRTVERLLLRGRDVHHDRPVLQVHEGHDVAGRVVGRRRLVPPGVGVRPEDHVVVLGTSVEIRLSHGVHVHQRHAPDRGFHGAPMHRAIGELAGGEGPRVLGASGLRACQREQDDPCTSY